MNDDVEESVIYDDESIEKDINDVSIESVDVYAEESVINNFKNKFKNVIVEKINEKY